MANKAPTTTTEKTYNLLPFVLGLQCRLCDATVIGASVVLGEFLLNFYACPPLNTPTRIRLGSMYLDRGLAEAGGLLAKVNRGVEGM